MIISHSFAYIMTSLSYAFLLTLHFYRTTACSWVRMSIAESSRSKWLYGFDDDSHPAACSTRSTVILHKQSNALLELYRTDRVVGARLDLDDSVIVTDINININIDNNKNNNNDLCESIPSRWRSGTLWLNTCCLVVRKTLSTRDSRRNRLQFFKGDCFGSRMKIHPLQRKIGSSQF